MPKKKCEKCGVPLEGILYNIVAKKIFGVKPSEINPELCNKCEANSPKEKKNSGCSCCGR